MPSVSLLSLSLSPALRRTLLAAALAPLLVAEATAEAPPLCEIASAFDAALKERYYRANYAADDADCRFVSAEGCRFDIGRGVVILVSHLGAVDCDDAGRCAFEAVQVCADGGPACRELMYEREVAYRVEGAFSPREGGGWRLADWARSPAVATGRDALGDWDRASLTALAESCPAL